MSSWETESGPPDITKKFKASLVKRALKRSGAIISEGKAWVVDGDTKLGDHYGEYTVVLPEGEQRYQCSCQTHTGGEYRNICSHILFVILARYGKTQFAGVRPELGAKPDSEEGTRPLEAPEIPFPEPLPEDPGNLSPREEIDRHFGEGLPAWLEELRPQQWEAVAEIERLFVEGKKVVFLDAPTGAGKSLIGELTRRRVAPAHCLYGCVTKTLQDQFLADFPYAAIIKGRSNYPTFDWPNDYPRISADLCDQSEGQCTLCSDIDMCPYRMAKNRALHAGLTVANIAYLLSVWNYNEEFKDAQLVILDEADTLESELMNFVEVTFTKKRLKEMMIGPPEKKTIEDTWLEWIRDKATPAVLAILKGFERQYRDYSDMPPKDKRDYKYWVNSLRKLRNMGGWSNAERRWLTEEDGFEFENWVYTDYDRGNVTFKPIRVDELAPELLWKWGERFLLMSATIISADQMAEDLGLEEDDWGLVTVDSTFPPERRPIYVEPVANMTHKMKDIAWPKMAERIGEIVEYHDSDRILVHTVSYAFSKYLTSKLKGNGRIITYTSARDRERALERFRKSPNGVVLAPSFDRGVDLPQDECRVVIVSKVPYPNLGDKQVSKRLYSRGGKNWYAMLTARTLVQMTGRAMRSEEDECEIYLLDRQFVSRVKKRRDLLPGWWQEALVMSGSPKERWKGNT